MIYIGNQNYICIQKGGKMTKFKKICEIQGYEENDICSVIKTLENQGFTVVDDNEDKDSWKTYHVLREV